MNAADKRRLATLMDASADQKESELVAQLSVIEPEIRELMLQDVFAQYQTAHVMMAKRSAEDEVVLNRPLFVLYALMRGFAIQYRKEADQEEDGTSGQ